MKLSITFHDQTAECTYFDLVEPSGRFWNKLCAKSEWNGTDEPFYKIECLPLINELFWKPENTEVTWGGGYQPLITIKLLSKDGSDLLIPEDVDALIDFQDLNDELDRISNSYGEETLIRLLKLAVSQRSNKTEDISSSHGS